MSSRQEIPHNTPEQVREYLAEALDLMGELEIPEHLQPVAFTAAVNLISAKQLILTQPAPLAAGLDLSQLRGH